MFTVEDEDERTTDIRDMTVALLTVIPKEQKPLKLSSRAGV